MRSNDFAHAPGCTGLVERQLHQEVTIPLDRIGIALLPVAPMLVCHECESAYFEDRFDEQVRDSLANWLCRVNRKLTQKEIQFVRLQKGACWILKDEKKAPGIFPLWTKQPTGEVAIYRPKGY